MAGISGDFTGFTFNGIHSSTLGITRVSDSNRYTEDLLPTRKHTTVEVTGSDGTYDWESFYTQKPIPINFAFDGLTEVELRRLRQVFGTKEQATLWFDERPYKQYLVKINGTPSLKALCFMEDGSRVYKGEGNIQFIAFSVYATARYKFINEYEHKNDNINEWELSSGLNKYRYDSDDFTVESTYDSSKLYFTKDDERDIYYHEDYTVDSTTFSQKIYYINNGNRLDGFSVDGLNIKIYNPGDIESDFYAYYNCVASGSNYYNSLSQVLCPNGFLTFATDSSAVLASGDIGFRINSRANVIEGINASGEITGNIYNQWILQGDWFKIPLCTSVSDSQYYSSTGLGCSKLDYNYIYY